MVVLTKTELENYYINRGMTDKEIGLKHSVSRTYISKLRKNYSIQTRMHTGAIGENAVSKKLKELNFDFYNMNNLSMTYEFDFLLSNGVRLEVKSAKVAKDGTFKIIFTEKESNENIVSENRIRLSNGRTKKIFTKTCDYFVLVCLEDNKDNTYYVIPSDYFSDDQQMIALTTTSITSKYNVYKNRWDLLKI